MIRALSTAASGMQAQQTKLDVTANNIANVSTSGFKKSRAEFQDLMYQTERQPGTSTSTVTRSPTGLQVGMGVRTVGTQRMHTVGDLKQTGNALDVAIEGNGFFQIQLPSGELVYSRDGQLKLDNTGQLVNSDGYPLSAGITFPPETQNITIGADGTVTAVLPQQTTPTQLGQIQVANFSNPSGLAAAGRNLYRETFSSGPVLLATPGQNGTGTLSQGTLESSNVKIVEEMIDLISGQRAYEINARVIKAADEMLEQSSNLR